MTDANVKEFFHCCLRDNISTKEKKSILSKECLKWHSDRLPRMFGLDKLDKTVTNLCEIAIRAAIEAKQKLD
jgi:hypothetical protein